MRVKPSWMGLVPFWRGSREIPCPFCHLRTQWEGASCEWKRALTKTQPCWHLDLGLSSLQNCEKYIPVVHKSPSFMLFWTKSLMLPWHQSQIRSYDNESHKPVLLKNISPVLSPSLLELWEGLSVLRWGAEWDAGCECWRLRSCGRNKDLYLVSQGLIMFPIISLLLSFHILVNLKDIWKKKKHRFSNTT